MEQLLRNYPWLTSASPATMLGGFALVLVFFLLCLVFMPPGFELTIRFGRRRVIRIRRRPARK
jgi:hypothetical protein